MRNLTLTVVILASVILTTASHLKAQTANNAESKTLTDTAFNLFNEGRLDDAIKAASKVVSIEKKAGRGSTSYSTAVLNLARMKRDKYIELEKRIVGPIRREAELGEVRATGAEAIELFEEVIDSNNSAGRSASAQTGDAMSDLAWLLYNYKFSSRAGEGKERVDRAEALFISALEILDKSRGPIADQTLLTVLAFGNFYQYYDNYEKALEQYERYLGAVEKTGGPADARAALALRPYAQIMHATYREPEAAAAITRVEKLTGRKDAVPMGRLELYSRSGDAVNHYMKVATSGFRDVWYINRARPMSTPLKVTYVLVTVDTTGRVIEAVAETKDADLKKRAEEETAKWFVRPFSYKGQSTNLRGIVRYVEIR